jgi:hypothetical protein
MTKFVNATESDVRVGVEKPKMVKMVAEKYIKEFCTVSQSVSIRAEEMASLRIHKVAAGLAESKQ